jgi:hypothetical protein
MREMPITLLEASKRLGVSRAKVSAAVQVLGLETERDPLCGNAQIMTEASLATLREKFSGMRTRKPNVKAKAQSKAR